MSTITTNALLKITFIQELIQKNGPDPHDYKALHNWFKTIYHLRKSGQLGKLGIIASPPI